MIRKYRTAILFLLLSLTFAIVSLPNSSALSQGSLQREVMAKISDDISGIIKLEGIDGNRVLDITNKFETIGAITNQSKQTVHITLNIATNILSANNKNIRLEYKIGNEIRVFSFEFNQPKQFTLQLQPGQKIDIQTALSNNSNVIMTSTFDLTVRDEAGAITLRLNDTSSTPRRLLCY